MDDKEKGFWVIGLFFAGIGLFVGFLVGFSFNGNPADSGNGLTGAAITEPGTEAACFDADGGTNVDVFGYAVDNNVRYFDNCKDAQYLYESFCTGGKVDVIKYKCPYGCGQNRCLQEPVY